MYTLNIVARYRTSLRMQKLIRKRIYWTPERKLARRNRELREQERLIREHKCDPSYSP